MKDSELTFDRSCHVLYSKPCKREIRSKIALHYPSEECEAVWERVQRQYAEFLSGWRTDLGGRKNFHNGVCGTYDCIALTAYYKVCREVTSLSEIETMLGEFSSAKKRCDRWHDYEMSLAPYDKDKPIYYEFTACPMAEFAKKHGMTEIMPALCNGDYDAMALLHARLVRMTTCANGCRCDYTICGDRDPYLAEHPEYRDEAGYRRNR